MPQSNQIGGKGSVRRKVYVKRTRNFNSKKNKEELTFDNMIKRINNYIEKIDDEYINVANVMIEDIVSDGFSDLERYDVKDKTLFKGIKEDTNKFFNDKLLTKTKRMKMDSYKTLQKYFIKDCITCIMDIYKDIDIFLEKKEYVEEQVDEIEFTDKQCFEFLGLDIATTPTKLDLKRAFKKKSFEYHPDKNPDEIDKYTDLYQNISISYKLIIKRYNLN
jgi:hypothetical protein